ncbi:MAG: hypothetical protein ACJAQ6_001720 [Arenicella sp.]|jgi:hypothetical protein
MILSNLMMGWPFVFGLALVCSVIAWFTLAKLKYRRAETIPVQRKSRLLSVAERNLFDCLVEGLSNKYFIFAKVPMKNVIEAAPNAQRLDLKRIDQELNGHYFDFVLCSQIDMSIFGVIELEHTDRTERRKSSAKRKRRDKMIARACKSANLKLFYFDARQDYKNVDICRLITGKSKAGSLHEERLSPTHQSQLTIDNSSHSIAGHARTCPKCRSEVVTKVSVKGRNIGEKFLMCRKYPYCDYRIALKDKESLKKFEQEEVRKSKTEGFKNWSAS